MKTGQIKHKQYHKAGNDFAFTLSRIRQSVVFIVGIKNNCIQLQKQTAACISHSQPITYNGPAIFKKNDIKYAYCCKTQWGQ